MRMKKDVFTLIGGFLTSLLLFLGTIGVQFDWFTQDSINAFVVLLSSFVALVVNLYAIWKNTYVSKKAQEQKKVLKNQGLIK
ncbi:PTS mannose transporter subunit IID [Bacillus sp. IB182487]|uniref:PTS mannose transporter subunit IID n=2 Tax=Metabacillus arenae TaxID=2771434 RepID=A0A926NJH9_9BACI|nr:PTS mannose transporter subunit IID [Metabacillus arenae]